MPAGQPQLTHWHVYFYRIPRQAANSHSQDYQSRHDSVWTKSLRKRKSVLVSDQLKPIKRARETLFLTAPQIDPWVGAHSYYHSPFDLTVPFKAVLILIHHRTWHGNSGEQWSPAQGLESVLLSIQSLLSTDPYHNEPGFEQKASSEASKINDYNSKVTYLVQKKKVQERN